jgi:hypothetical protein
MLPRTMSQGNDALVSKDAESATNDTPDDRGSSEAKSSDASSTASDVSESGEPERKRSRRPTSTKRRSQEEVDADAEAEADDDEAEGDDEEQDEPESERPARKAAKSDRDADAAGEGRARKARRAGQRRSRDDDEDERLVPPETEEAVNVPKMETVYMLGAMSVLTVILWFAAKLSCNIHPDQVRDPKHFSTKDLAADAKNAAFEFQQRFETGDYITSYDLATGELRRIVEGKLKECEQTADECAAHQKKLAGTIQSTPKVLEQTPTKAAVEIQSYYSGSPSPKTFAFDVVKEGDFWRVASRREVANAPAQPVSPAAVPAAPVNAEVPATGNGASAAPAPVESPEQPAQQ